MLSPCQPPMPDGNPVLAVCYILFGMFLATLHIYAFSVRSLRTHHAVVTGDPLYMAPNGLLGWNRGWSGPNIRHSTNKQYWKGICTLWSTLTFQRCSLRRITGDDVSRTTKVIKCNSGIQGNNYIQGHCWNNAIKGYCKCNERCETYMDRPISCSSITVKLMEHLKMHTKCRSEKGKE